MDLHEFSRQLAGFQSAVASSPDLRLEDDGILMLGRLESLLEQLPARSKSDDMKRRLETGKKILVELLDFVTQRFGNGAVARDLSRICALRDTIRDLQRLLARAFWTNLFNAKSTHEELRQQAYRRVGTEFTAVFRDLLSVVDGHFESGQRRREWQSSCRLWIDEFRQRW